MLAHAFARYCAFLCVHTISISNKGFSSREAWQIAASHHGEIRLLQATNPVGLPEKPTPAAIVRYPISGSLYCTTEMSSLPGSSVVTWSCNLTAMTDQPRERWSTEYLSLSFWSPNQLCLINHLELIQDRSARFKASSYSRDTSITALKTSLSIVSLNTRHIISGLVLHIFYYHHPYAHIFILELPSRTSAGLNHSQGIKRFSGSTAAFNISFFPNSIITSSNLSSHIVCITNYRKFGEHVGDCFSLLQRWSFLHKLFLYVVV